MENPQGKKKPKGLKRKQSKPRDSLGNNQSSDAHQDLQNSSPKKKFKKEPHEVQNSSFDAEKKPLFIGQKRSSFKKQVVQVKTGQKHSDKSSSENQNKKSQKKKAKQSLATKSANNQKTEPDVNESSSENEDSDIEKELQARKKKLKKLNKLINRAYKEKEESSKSHANDEQNDRTLFVGNVPATIKKKHLLQFFNKYGKVVSVRLRCVTPLYQGMSKRKAVIKKLINPKRTTLHSYVTFENREDAVKALETNGSQYKGHHLRVQLCDDVAKPDAKKAIFIGNLPFNAEDDDLWTALESCGKIQSVRIVRNAATGMGIGVGYVNFESTDSVELAVQMGTITVKNKEARIKRYQEKKSRKEREDPKAERNRRSDRPTTTNQGNKESKVKDEKSRGFSFAVKKFAYQGTQFSQKKKKHRVNKGFVQKMKLSKKIAPK